MIQGRGYKTLSLQRNRSAVKPRTLRLQGEVPVSFRTFNIYWVLLRFVQSAKKALIPVCCSDSEDWSEQSPNCKLSEWHRFFVKVILFILLPVSVFVYLGDLYGALLCSRHIARCWGCKVKEKDQPSLTAQLHPHVCTHRFKMPCTHFHY